MVVRNYKIHFLALLTILIVFLASQSVLAAISVPDAATSLPNPSGGIKTILDNLAKWALGVFGALAILGFVISGIQYVTAAGDDDQAKLAKKNITYSIIGVTIALAGYIIIKAIETALKGTSSTI